MEGKDLHAGQDNTVERTSTQREYVSAVLCRECHQNIYAQWEKSMHAHATNDPIFEASYAQAYVKTGGAAKKICLRCHAPTTMHTGDYEQKLDITHEGVTCDFCHSVIDVNLSNLQDPFISNPVTTGPIADRGVDCPFHLRKRPDPTTTSEFCAGCHEYTGADGVSLMETYTEWKESPYAKQRIQCHDCHTPHSEGMVREQSRVKFREAMARGYAPSGVLSFEEGTRAIDTRILNVEREGGSVSVVVQLTNVGSGHKVPTGIPARSLVLICEIRTLPDGKTMTRQKMYKKKVVDQQTGKEFVEDSDLMIKPGRIDEDNRLGPFETRTEKFKFMVDPGKDISIKAYLNVVYQPVVIQKTEMKIHVSGDQKEIPALHHD
jgi:ribosomal protein S14/ribosomal protein L40E